MAVLSNSKHERFAQLLFKGETQIEAYTQAGYKPNPSAASRLAEDVKICERVAELQQRAATRTEITVASITDRLLAIATKGEASSEAQMLSVARASLMDAAKLNGLAPDKVEVSGPNGGPIKTEGRLDIEGLTLEQKRALASIPVHGG